jgi:thioredoxin-related protein
MRQVKSLLILGLLLTAVGMNARADNKEQPRQKPEAKSEQPKAQAPAEKSGEITWMEYDAGLKKAREENKHVFIDFTAKWCGWCKKMDRETFKEPDVVKLINESFVPVRVDGDSPNELDVDGYKITEKSLTRNEFGVRGYPSFWFLKPDGTKLGKIDGYHNKDYMLEALTFVRDYKYDTTRASQSGESDEGK